MSNTVRAALDDLIDAMDYHIEQTRPIELSTIALAAARIALAQSEAQPDAYPALQALTEAVLTKADADYMRRQLDEAVRIMATRGWAPPVPYPQQADEPVALMWLCLDALHLAGAICDAVPNRQPGHLGELVNAQPDGRHGYATIQNAEYALRKYLTTPEAAPAAPAYVPLSEFQRMQIIGDEFPIALVRPIIIQKIDAVCRAIERAVRVQT